MTLRERSILTGASLLCISLVVLLTSCNGGGIIPGRGRDREPVVNEEAARADLRAAQEFMKTEPPQPARANVLFKSAIESDYRLLPAHIGHQDSFFAYYNPQAQLQVRQLNEMQQMYEKYAKKYPSEAMFQYLYGRMLDKMNQRREAVPYLKAALKLDSQYYLAHADLAGFYDEVDKSPALAKYHREKSERYRVIHELKTGLAADPSDVSLHRRYQDVMLLAEESRDVPSGTVLEEYRRRLQDAKAGDQRREAQYQYLYGRLLGQTGDLEEAREHFERASALDDRLPWPYDGLATYYIRKAQEPGVGEADSNDYINKALQMLEKAVRKDPNQTAIRLKLSALYMEVSSLRLSQAEVIRAGAEGGILTREDERRIKSLLRDAYRFSNECKSLLLETFHEGVKEPNLYQQLATLMFGDGCYFMARKTALTGLVLLGSNPPGHPQALEKIKVKLTGIAKDCKVYMTRLQEGRDTSEMPFPQLFFKDEFRARMQSKKVDFRARTVKDLALFYAQVMRDREKIDESILHDYERMQGDALVQIGLALEDSEDKVRKEAINVLGVLRVQPFCEGIGKILQDPKESADLRWEATLALGAMRTVDAVNYLITGLKDEDDGVREESAKGLRKLGVQTFGYDFDDKLSVRAEKTRRIEEWWKENMDTHRIPQGD